MAGDTAKETGRGALMGGALGAVAGAAIGAAVGGIGGGAKLGFGPEEQYKISYKKCMENRGHKVIN